VNVAVVLAAMFLLGLAEVFADSAAQTLLPMVVAKPDLGIGNARMMAGFVTTNQLVGPAVGAALFTAGRSWPFLGQAVCVALGVVLIARMRLPVVPRAAERGEVWRDILEGLRWTWHHAPVRTLTLTIVAFNVTYGAAWSVLVLYADQRLDAGAVGFGLLSTFTALGGIAGTLAYDWLENHFSLGNIMRGGLVIETLTHLALAVTTVPWVAFAIMFVFGAHAFVWGTTSRTVRMRSVPNELQGRVGSLYMIGVFGGLVVGQGIGGVIARIWGVTGPFWFAFAGSAVLLAVIWRQLTLIAHDAGEPAG
jgi:MFS family permease